MLENIVCSQADSILINKPVESERCPSQVVFVANGTVRVEPLVLRDPLEFVAETHRALNIESTGVNLNQRNPVWIKSCIEVLAAEADGMEVRACLQVCAGVAA